MKRIYLFTAILFFILGQLAAEVWKCNAEATEQPKYVELMIDNPYKIAAQLLVECNWSNELRGYEYRKVIFINSKTSQTIQVPSNLKRCNIWPRILF